MGDRRHCLYCGKLLRLALRPIARFDSDRCRVANFRLNLALEDLPSVRALRELFCDLAPAEAHGYRLGVIRADRSCWFYPSGERLTMRWNGRLSRRPYFRMWPFEPPVLPGPDIYGVQLLSKQGELLETPDELQHGVFIRPGHSILSDAGERE
jgi:hypothetical protein